MILFAFEKQLSEQQTLRKQAECDAAAKQDESASQKEMASWLLPSRLLALAVGKGLAVESVLPSIVTFEITI